jgi:hypothetical protein
MRTGHPTTRPAAVVVGTLGLLAIATAACADEADGSGEPFGDRATTTPLEAAREEAWPGSRYIEVEDDGYTLIIDGDGEDAAGAGIDAITAVPNALDTLTR